MPFSSKAQQRYMFAAESKGELPEGTARRWAKETKSFKNLPEHVKKAAFEDKVANMLFEKIAQNPIAQSTFPSNPGQAWKADSSSSASFMSKSVNHPRWARSAMDSTAMQGLGSRSFGEAGMMMSKRESTANWAAKDPALAPSRQRFISNAAQQLSNAGNKARDFMNYPKVDTTFSRIASPKYIGKAVGVQSAVTNTFKNTAPAVDSLKAWYPQVRGWLK